ncbi:nucleoside recognition domain-containing protein [Fontivita pretiosa]|uniref:nucleoside recognition domain-containing protein n=1 Tax=Fontivita pretiosa TaxID=2989684 RepID=UPI003D171B92
MLNYIWAGLIIFSLIFALNGDVGDLIHDTYRNGVPLPAVLRIKAADPAAAQTDVQVVIDPAIYAQHFKTDATPSASYPGTMLRADGKIEIRFAADLPLPQPLATIRDQTGGEQRVLRAVAHLQPAHSAAPSELPVMLVFDPVRFVRLRGICQAAFDFAKTAVTIAIGLIGTLALWLGLMRIAEASGLVEIFVRLVHPLLRPLFPQIPRGHPALGMIAMNLAANVLGLGNAATPFGIKAMQELQKLNRSDDTATDPMVMLLAINTAGVQLVPPALLVAVVGITVTELFVPIVLVTGGALIVAIIACKLFQRLPWYRRTNPDLMLTDRPTESHKPAAQGTDA